MTILAQMRRQKKKRGLPFSTENQPKKSQCVENQTIRVEKVSEPEPQVLTRRHSSQETSLSANDSEVSEMGFFFQRSIFEDEILNRYSCTFCDKIGACKFIPTMWRGVLLHYIISCQRTKGGCGNERRQKTVNSNFNQRVAAAMKFSGIRNLQFYR